MCIRDSFKSEPENYLRFTPACEQRFDFNSVQVSPKLWSNPANPLSWGRETHRHRGNYRHTQYNAQTKYGFGSNPPFGSFGWSTGARYAVILILLFTLRNVSCIQYSCSLFLFQSLQFKFIKQIPLQLEQRSTSTVPWFTASISDSHFGHFIPA